MALKEIQKQVDDWIRQYKIGYWPVFEQLARLTEEVGELARELNDRYGSKPKKQLEEIKELEDELADVIFTVACLANSQNLDLDKGFKRVMAKCYSRDDNRWEKK